MCKHRQLVKLQSLTDMRKVSNPPVDTSHYSKVCHSLIQELLRLRQSILHRESTVQETLARVSPKHRDSARNLIHYLALRVHDLRPLQEQLAWLGLSSLGRSESHVLANLDKVLGILHCLTGQPWVDQSAQEPAGSVSSRRLLEHHAVALLGECPVGRPVRIMVTLPSNAATDFAVVRDLVDAGMDIARINCAHDEALDWEAMVLNVRRAAKGAQRPVRILMDLGGPKIRTGDVAPRPPVLRMRPQKDEYGRPFRPYRLGLQSSRSTQGVPDVDGCIGVADKKWQSTLAFQIESLPGVLHLHRGDVIRVTKDGMGHPAVGDTAEDDMVSESAHIACTLPQVIDQVQVGERIWFDDGRIGGVIRQVGSDGLNVEITQAREGGEKLIGDKGINLPDSELDLPALTAKDLQDLVSVAKLADMVGLSFVQHPADVYRLRDQLDRAGRCDIGIVLKIETLKGFENLPELMLAALAGECAGVMIARGDLAVECGYERLAEVQEEILWCAEAAHVPVIWATQVLETLAKTGVPSRAEISDAGLGVRAECVMLNKGPYITDAIRTLDDILRRMGAHQVKKRSLLRALRAWSGAETA